MVSNTTSKEVSNKHDEIEVNEPLLITTLVTSVSGHFECFCFSRGVDGCGGKRPGVPRADLRRDEA